MIVVGLTGSIAMGKTETAKILRSLGIAVFDSDADVHEMYRSDRSVIERIAELVPSAEVDGTIDRQRLSKAISEVPETLQAIETIVHPAVRKHQNAFLERSRLEGRTMAVLDIPLLYESGQAGRFDKIMVVSAPEDVQRKRALSRPGMTPEKLEFILSRQTPDCEKRRRADYVIDTSKGLDDARRQVEEIIRDINSSQGQR